MSGKVLYAIDIKQVVTNAIVGIVLGTVLTFVPMSTLFTLTLILVAISIIVLNGIRLYKRVVNGEKTSNEMLLDVLGILFGMLLLVFHSVVMVVVAAIYLVVEPIIYLLLSKFDKNLMWIELPKIALGVILFVTGVAKVDAIFKVIGVIVLVASLVYLGLNYYLYKKSGIKIVDGSKK